MQYCYTAKYISQNKTRHSFMQDSQKVTHSSLNRVNHIQTKTIHVYFLPFIGQEGPKLENYDTILLHI